MQDLSLSRSSLVREEWCWSLSANVTKRLVEKVGSVSPVGARGLSPRSHGRLGLCQQESTSLEGNVLVPPEPATQSWPSGLFAANAECHAWGVGADQVPACGGHKTEAFTTGLGSLGCITSPMLQARRRLIWHCANAMKCLPVIQRIRQGELTLTTLPIAPQRVCNVPPLPIFYSQAPTAQLLQDPSEPALRVRLLRLDHFLHVVQPFLLQHQRGKR